MKIQPARLLLGALAFGAFATIGAPSATACGHFMAEERAKLQPFPQPVAKKPVHHQAPVAQAAPKHAPLPLVKVAAGEALASLTSAEDAIEKRNPELASAILDQLYPNLVAGTPRQGASVARALELMAVAIVRTDGKVSDAGLASKTREERLDWARVTLSRIADLKTEDVRLKSHYAEALAKGPAPHHAKQMLEDLAAADLLPNADGFAALGKLRRAAGDVAAAEAAESQCRSMSKGGAFCGGSVTKS